MTAMNALPVPGQVCGGGPGFLQASRRAHSGVALQLEPEEVRFVRFTVPCSCADGVNVGARQGVVRAAILLQRGVGQGADAADDGDRARVLRVERLDQPEVHELDAALGRELDVRRFDIAVDDRRRLSVEILQGIEQLRQPVENCRLAQEFPPPPRPVHQLAQIWPVHVVHHQVAAPILDEEVIHFGEVGVVQASEDHGLAAELRLRLGHLGRRGVGVGADLLDGRETPAEAHVFGGVHRPTTPLADKLDDSIAGA